VQDLLNISSIKELTIMKKILVLCLDLSEAFDCVSHEIILKKCERYGLLGKSEEWIRSYLGDILIGEQYVEIRTTGSKVVKSSNKKILSGIPQGSVLGPLMLSMYVNDLPNFISSVADIVMFADD